MSRKRYRYNPQTLQFEKLQESTSRKYRYIFITFGLLIAILVIPRVFTRLKFPSPKLVFFAQRNSELKRDYDQLNKKLNDAEFFLYKIQKRDDKVYRPVFNLKPIPPSVREAGFGGAEDYNEDLYSIDIEFVKEAAQKLDQLFVKTRIESNSLEDLYEKAKTHSLFLDRIPSMQPISPSVPYRITSSFGYRKDPFTGNKKSHHGIDLAGPLGVPIYATGAGIVEVACYSRHGYGNEVVINHGYGFKSIYAHLSAIKVKKGDRVRRGEIVGELGNTGRSTGPHLHYEIRKQNSPVNPLYYYYEDITADEFKEITAFNSN